VRSAGFGVSWIAAVLVLSCSPRVQPETLGSVLWMQTSSEYRAAALQTYRAAAQHLNPALNDKAWTAALEQTGDVSALPPAVILDVDETVLDNSLYLGEWVLRGAAHGPQEWDEWVQMMRAPAVPGAVEFVRAAAEKGIRPIYITNRPCGRRHGTDSGCPQKQDTLENLRSAGFPSVDPDQVLLRGEREAWGADKSSRRAHVAERYRVLMLLGDDLGDFLPYDLAGRPPRERADSANRHGEMWGTRWFVLPNPVYGSWRRVLREPVVDCVRGFDRPEGPGGVRPDR
jgi:5'-nucleotidase (lipoprotein e(P4) family)